MLGSEGSLMRNAGKFLWLAVFVLMLVAGSGVFVFGAGSPAKTLNLPDEQTNVVVDDNDVPDVTARVGRISFIRGDAQIRRTGTQDWENITLNLPVVEGDEITTSSGSRIEIQFDAYEHLRLDENSYIQVLKMKDEGIAVSIPNGRLSLRITTFDKNKSYFEIDAPNTTLAVQRSGMYRVDAGKKGDAEVRVSATDDGEARIYSDNAGFTLKNGRSARIFVDGSNAGEWNTGDAALYADDFDSWALDRDTAIAKRLKDAYYNKYYDNDIYGADDLNDNGEWIHLRKYGYVWRPFHTSINSYSNWSPYRYGQWRWTPPFGWTWVNDEPWGWATYHHGRWFYDDGYWYWSPYGAYRYSRSWWFPALVGISSFSDSICWYPLPYEYNYYNYNYYYYNNNGGGWDGHHEHGGHHHPPGPTPTPTPGPNGGGGKQGIPPHRLPPISLSVPPGAVVAQSKDQFGTRTRGNVAPPISVATTILSRPPDESYRTPILPVFTEVKQKISPEIRSGRPPITVSETQVRTGAAKRVTDRPLDQELRNTRIFGDRKSVETNSGPKGVMSGGGSTERRGTGVVERPPDVKKKERSETITPRPVYIPPATVNDGAKPEPARRPRPEPPIRQEPPHVQPPRPDPPRREPPQPKSEPKPAPKPTPPSERHDGSKKKDGR